ADHAPDEGRSARAPVVQLLRREVRLALEPRPGGPPSAIRDRPEGTDGCPGDPLRGAVQGPACGRAGHDAPAVPEAPHRTTPPGARQEVSFGPIRASSRPEPARLRSAGAPRWRPSRSRGPGRGPLPGAP